MRKEPADASAKIAFRPLWANEITQNDIPLSKCTVQ
jgi:hypothetical protein